MPDQIPQPSTHEDLASFGEELRREREIRGISLKEIADATKVSRRFLEAIERNDHRTLPAPVFTRGFIREYARYLGLNADEMVSRYNQAAAGDERIEMTPHLERLVHLQTGTPQQKQGIPPPYARIDRNFYVLAAIVIALSAVTLWAVRMRQQPRAESDSVVPQAATMALRPVTTTEPAAAVPEDVLRLTIELTDDSWITLEADGRTVVNEELRRGDRRTFEANEEFRFRTIGNAGGVVITLNDATLQPLGRSGQVLRDRTFDRRFLETLGPESRSRP
ncbi:MAG TPA: RodZ domain-containing protein [Thermoanaerobaculia bacterium]|nr:RodZ domain-containing protein [Thermoanaerobaculia bacterium]